VSENELIYDWNLAGAVPIPPGTQILVNDETLRDGLQNPSIHDPSIEDKIEILHFMEALGIDAVNIGLPGAGPRALQHVEALAREIVACHMRIRPNCAARTMMIDIQPIAEIAQETSLGIALGDPAGVRRELDAWRESAVALSDPRRRAALITPLEPDELVEITPE